MSIGTSVSLSKDSPTDIDTNLSVYDLRAADIDYSEYSVAGVALPEEKKFSVSHETRKGGVLGHRIQLSRAAVDANLVPATTTISLVIVRPPSTAITNALIIEEVNKLIDFLIEGGTNANVSKVLNREV